MPPLGRFPLWRILLMLAGTISSAAAGPVISEFMADNKSTLPDENGDYSDWVEIYNPDPGPVNLAGWYLSDTSANLTKWMFPAVSLESGQFLIVFASNKNRAVPGSPLHTNFALTAGGEYLALVAPDGVTKATEFPFPFPPQKSDVSFGYAFSASTMVAAKATAQYKIPTDGSLGATWVDPGFVPAGWSSGQTGLGYGMLVSGMVVDEVRSATEQTMSLAVADALLQGVGASDTNSQVRATLNFLGDGSDGHYGSNVPFSISGDYHVLKASGQITIPAAGAYTFGLSSDEGGRIRIDLNGDGDFLDSNEEVMVDDRLHAVQDHLGTATFAATGSFPFEVVYFDYIGGDSLEFFASAGARTAWDATFRLVGDTANGGLAVLALPDGSPLGGLVGKDVRTAMQSINSTLYARLPFTLNPGVALENIFLDMSYNDGFIAYLNGTEVARRNAPVTPSWNSTATAARTNAASIIPESINLSTFRSLFVTGPNVLAIQGLNTTAADGTFLLLPELTGSALLNTTQPYFFKQPTPRTANSTPTTLGFLADTTFSVKRGIYSTAFTLNIGCATPGSSIVYTTDGSMPTETNGTVVPPATPASPGLASILINKTTPVRAFARQLGYTSTNVDTSTYIFLSSVLAQPINPPGWPAAGNTINSQILDYEMDPEIVNNANSAIGGNTAVRNSLMALPSVCLTLPVSALTDASTGIYVNARGDGFEWEREGAIEMLNDPNTVEKGFHAHCGIRIRGGYSRDASNPKHGWRIFFRSEYGDGKLKYPIFFGDDTATDTFDKFDLNSSQNYSWSFGGDAQNVFIRDQICNDMQLGTGSLSQHNRYIHLYINGLYWGVYGIQERPEAAFASSYLGGTSSDYDVVKQDVNGYVTIATDGDLNAWQELWNKSRACYFINKDQNPNGSPHAYTQTEKNAAYFKMMGLAADGVTPTSDPVLLDPDELINYMMIIFHSGNNDAPLSNFLGNNNPNNYYGLRDRRGGHGFFFVAHDSEHTFEASAAGVDRTGPWNNPLTGSWTNFLYSNPQFTHQDVRVNKEYQMRWADMVYKHLIDPRGTLSVAANQARVTKRATELEPAMIAESARWGDSKVAAPLTIVNWRNAKDGLFNFLPARNAVLIAQLQQDKDPERTDRLYPLINPPTLSPLGGTFAGPLNVDISSDPFVASYFTVDGPDPRRIGGSVDPAAQISAFTVENVASGAVWKFLDDGSNQGTAWKEPNFYEIAWMQLVDGVLQIKSGPSRLGYGEIGPVSTASTVGYVDTDPVTPGVQRNITTYFRHSFNIPDPSILRSVTLEFSRDDGCVIYLNGKEMGRSNLPAAPAVISYNTPALANVGSADSSAWRSLPIELSDLLAGTNVLAAEVHQSSPSSGDMGFNLRLRTLQNSTAAPKNLGSGLHIVRTRTRDADGNWSALNEQAYLVDGEAASSTNLIIQELMYNPQNPTNQEVAAGFGSDNAFQWLEIRNVGPKIIDLRGAYFNTGITFTFPFDGPVKTLAPGGRALLVGNLAGYQIRYGHSQDANIAGVFDGDLDRGGEQLVLKSVNGVVLLDFTYGDSAPWPTAADGDSYSLVFSGTNMGPPGAASPGSIPSNWHSSATPGGTPGIDEEPANYAAWKALHNITDGNADQDGDGIINFMEYSAGTDPNITNEVPIIVPSFANYTLPPGQVSGNYFTITHLRNLAADDILWTMEISPAVNGVWQTTSAVLVGETNNRDGTATMTYRLPNVFPSSGTRYFARARSVLK